MNKSERLHDMMLFLKDKKSFNLKDLMNKYSISKSTALRDIASLENIGLPIYSQQGRNGHYSIIHNKLLSPMVFNIQEVYALYFSMITLKAYESTPFQLSLDTLKSKFKTCLTNNQINELNNIEKVFRLASIEHGNESPFLSNILQYAIEEKVCTVRYIKNAKEKDYTVQFFNISSAYGQWYATAYNFDTKSTKVFRCDKIVKIQDNKEYTPKPLNQLLRPNDALYKTCDATEYDVEISKDGVDLYYKEHYPSMTLYCHDDRYFIRGYYNPGEEDFIAKYFLDYGKSIMSIQPLKLKELITQRLSLLTDYFNRIKPSKE